MFPIIDNESNHVGDATIFYNLVAVNGYFWDNEQLQKTSGDEKYFFPLKELTKAKMKERLEAPYKRFVSLSGTPESFINFANTYGPIIPIPRKGPLPLNSDEKYYLSLTFWTHAHESLRVAHDIFLSINDTNALWERLTIYAIPNYEKYPDHEVTSYSCDSFQSFTHQVMLLQKDECRLNVYPADSDDELDFRFTIFHEELNNCKKPTLSTIALIWLWKLYTENTRHGYRTSSEYSLRYDAASNKWYPMIRPQTLLAAMWYQFGEELAGNRRYKQCLRCGEWQDVTDKNKNWKVHESCAIAYRVKKYRDKNKLGQGG